jgi:hypothetical protein
LDLYRSDLSLEQIAAFEYFTDIAKFSKNGIFKIRYKTIQDKLRIGRRKAETIIEWLKEIGLLREKPRERSNEIRAYFLDFDALRFCPDKIFAKGIPVSEQYDFLLRNNEHRKRIEIFKRKRYEKNLRLQG